jgi:tRNA(Ile)-lysidine synthase
MHLFLDWAKQQSSPVPQILIVDHGLRPEAHAEAKAVAACARKLSVKAHVLRWTGRKPRSNIEEAARTARYRLLGAWCEANGITKLFVGHTAEDQAETFLMRLARGSGVDGLSGMRPRAPLPVAGFDTVQLLRPLLDLGRAELRAHLSALGVGWIDDPMNEEDRFARVRIRKALPELEAAGVPVWRITQAAGHLARAREALDAAAQDFVRHHTRLERGRALIDGARLAQVPREIGLRALVAVLQSVGGAVYRPRFERLEALLDASVGDSFAGRTLSGCRIGLAPKAQAAFGPATLLISRESGRGLGSERSKTTLSKEVTETLPKSTRAPASAAV